MSEDQSIVYPYIPNSVPAVKKQMLEAVGAESTEDLFEDVPEKLRLDRRMNLPEPLEPEYALKRHTEGILAKNTTAGEHLSFLAAGCSQHHLPAVAPRLESPLAYPFYLRERVQAGPAPTVVRERFVAE